MKTTNILALIPARYASTRFPGKPLADIMGKPMIQHVYERAKSVFEHCYVATDDTKIEECVKAFGGKVVMTSTSHRSGTDRCAEALDKVEKELGMTFRAVINIQGDEPFVNTRQLELLGGCFENADCELATLVKPIEEVDELLSPNKPKVVLSADKYALYFSREPIPHMRGVENKAEWIKKHTYYNHIGLYGYRSDVLRAVTKLPHGALEDVESLEQLRWLENGYKIKVEVTETEGYSIDTPEDLQFVINLLKNTNLLKGN